MIDTDAAVRELLAESPTMRAVVSSRIYCPYLPKGFDPNEAAGISYSCRGGMGEKYVPLVRPSYQFKCWGRDLEEARAVYGYLREYLDGLQGVTLTRSELVIANEQVYGQDFVDPQTGWHSILAFYELVFRTTARGVRAYPQFIGTGRTIVPVAGTAVQLHAAMDISKVIISALQENAGAIVVGGSAVVALLANRQGTPIYSGESLTLDIGRIGEIYLDAEHSGDGVSYTYYQFT